MMIRRKCRNFLLCFLLLLILGSFNTYATFISPGKVHIDFQPNLETELVFLVGDAANINVTLSGQLAEYAEIIDISDIPPDQGLRAKRVTVALKLPEFIETPGKNEIDVKAVEVPKLGQGIGTAVGVIAPIYIYIPYPGVYVVTRFKAPNINENETVNFVITASNLGWENISNSWGEIDVLGPTNNLITTLKTESRPLLSRTKDKEYSAEWGTVGYPAGDYFAKARFYYRNNISRTEKQFKIGHLIVYILNYTRTVKFQTINPFDVIIQSGWNSEIPNVYAMVTVNQSSFQTPSVSLAPWEKKTLKGYFDTNALMARVYDADIVVHYEGFTNSLKGKVEILPPPKKKLIEQPTIIYAGIITILPILLAISVVLFILFKRKRKEVK